MYYVMMIYVLYKHLKSNNQFADPDGVLDPELPSLLGGGQAALKQTVGRRDEESAFLVSVGSSTRIHLETPST